MKKIVFFLSIINYLHKKLFLVNNVVDLTFKQWGRVALPSEIYLVIDRNIQGFWVFFCFCFFVIVRCNTCYIGKPQHHKSSTWEAERQDLQF